MKIFTKSKANRCRRDIYFLGKRIWSYRRPVDFTQDIQAVRMTMDKQLNQKIQYIQQEIQRICPEIQDIHQAIQNIREEIQNARQEMDRKLQNKAKELRSYMMPAGFSQMKTDVFLARTGKLPNEPLTKFTDKIIWSMMFNPTPLKKQYADKLLVRDYIKEQIGEQYLPNVLVCWDNPADINVDKLPDSFVLKSCNGSGNNMIIKDKNAVDIDSIRMMCRKWMARNFTNMSLEMQYYEMPRIVFAEEYLDMDKYEYHAFVFHGKVRFIRVMTHKYDEDHHGTKFFDADWNEQPFYSSRYKLDVDVPRPKQLETIIKLSEKLCAQFDFVRCDWVVLKNGDIKFSEMTFSPAAGTNTFKPVEDAESVDELFGRYLNIPDRNVDGSPN